MSIVHSLAAFAAAVLAGTGVGGGGLFVIYLTAICGMEQLPSQARNLIFFICASLAALPYHLRHRRLRWREILFFAVLGTVGTLAGGALRKAIPPHLMRPVFGVFLTVTGGLSVVKLCKKIRKKGAKNDKNQAKIPS